MFCGDKCKSHAKSFWVDHGTMHDEYNDPIVKKMQSPVNPPEIVLEMFDHQYDDAVMAFLLALHRNLSNRECGASWVRFISRYSARADVYCDDSTIG